MSPKIVLCRQSHRMQIQKENQSYENKCLKADCGGIKGGLHLEMFSGGAESGEDTTLPGKPGKANPDLLPHGCSGM